MWNGAFHHGLENCLFQTWQWEKQDMPAVLGGFRKQGFARADQVVNYVVSHDERRPEYEIQFWGEHIQLGKRQTCAVRDPAGSWPCRRRGSGWRS